MHRFSLVLLYGLTLIAIIYLIAVGGGYYSLALTERPHHPLHLEWKPGGIVGHGLGIVGSALMMILLLYSLRKRVRFAQRWGNIRFWLNYHIWMGVTGPLLVLFHTSFKFGGIVSISFWSMTAVALSGVLGRYIYIQIPRSLSGHELSRRELDELDREMNDQLSVKYGVDEKTLDLIQQASGAEQATGKSGFAGLLFWITQDLALPFTLGRIRRHLQRMGRLAADERRKVLRIARRKVKLHRRMAFLSTAHRLLHHWHLLHKPFAIVMLLIMLVHVVVTILFGYRWIWGNG